MFCARAFAVPNVRITADPLGQAFSFTLKAWNSLGLVSIWVFRKMIRAPSPVGDGAVIAAQTRAQVPADRGHILPRRLALPWHAARHDAPYKG
jgi:hypothetical protein